MGHPLEPAPERTPTPVLSARVRLRCTWCRDHIEREAGVFCAECLAPHHPECRAAHGTCAAPGCGSGHLLRPDAPPRRPAKGRAARIAAGVLLGLAAAAIGGWTAAWVDGCEARVAPDVEARVAPDVEARVAPDVEARVAPDVEARVAPDVEARVAPDVDARVAPDGDARVRARSSETDADSLRRGSLASPLPETETKPTVYSWELTTIRLVTEGFAHAFELAPGDQLLFRSWAGSREVLRVPERGPAELILVAPAAATIEVRRGSGHGEAYATVTAEETCSIQIEVGGCTERIIRGDGPEALRLATQR